MGDRDEYDIRREFSRRRMLQGMLATAGVAAAGSGLTNWLTQEPARASGLVRKPGSRPYPGRPEGVDTMPQIEHIVIYMQENQSYDHYFGTLGRGDGFHIGSNGKPTNFNLDAKGNKVTVFHQLETCNAISGDHSWNGTHQSINHGKMDGFAKDSGSNVMGYYDETNLPFYRGLANTFPICDRWFCSVPGPTYPNRRFLQAATSVGVITTDVSEVLATPTAPNGTIWDRLDAHGITWKDYAIDIWDIVLFPTTNITKYEAQTAPNRRYFADFLEDCAKGTLPQVSILAPGVTNQYDEGSQDVQNGEAYSSAIFNAVMESSAWDKTVIIMTWDEHGGGYDHVPPPVAIAPDNIKPRLKPGDYPGDFAQYGVRVGGLVVSPWSKPNYVSHVVHDHTSILKFVETKFNLGAMTYRDANADDLMDCLDLSHQAFPEPPDMPRPGIPAAGSSCQPQVPPYDYPRPHGGGKADVTPPTWPATPTNGSLATTTSNPVPAATAGSHSGGMSSTTEEAIGGGAIVVLGAAAVAGSRLLKRSAGGPTSDDGEAGNSGS